MLIWGAKNQPSTLRKDRRAQQRVAGPKDAQDFLNFLQDSGGLEQAQVERVRSALSAGRFDCLPVLITELGLMAEADLTAAIARFCELPVLDEKALPEAPVLTAVFSKDLCQRKRILPVNGEGEGEGEQDALVALVDPFDSDLMASTAYALGRPVRFAVIGPVACETALRTLYGSEEADEDPAGEAGFADDALDRLEDMSRRAPIIRLTNHLFRAAFDHGATDIHVEPGETDLRIRYRVDGMLVFPETYPRTVHSGLSTRLKILSGLNIAERRLPQDGRMKLVDRGNEVDVRVSVLPTPHGESLVLRLLGRSLAAAGFESLGFSTALTGSVRRMFDRPNGLFLVTGPTGSGKTTTLYTALSEVNDRTRKIITVEDPVEYRISGVTQVQAHSDIGLDFAAALRSILRQDPDVVMIGEIRDGETAHIAVQAALTGHLVLSTLHTNSAAATVTRLIDMGLQPYLLAAVLNGVLAQRLLRVLCTHCKVSEPATEQEEILIRRYRPDLPAATPMLAKPCGCEHCAGTGYHGRTVVAEALELDRNLREMIADSAPEASIADYARRRGMRSLAHTGVDKALSLEVSLEDVMRSLDVEHLPPEQEDVA